MRRGTFRTPESRFRKVGLTPYEEQDGTELSLARKTATYSVAAAVIALAVILASSTFVGPMASNSSTTTGSSQSSASGSQSQLLIELTDPPSVPHGTTSLNLTYSSISLLVGEPGAGGQISASTITVTPSGGSATVNLLSLENVSQTVASADLPTGSTIYSVTFSVTSIAIEVNGTSYPVVLATAAASFSVDLLGASVAQGTNALLLDLNPTVISTSTGYQLIPSSTGIMRPQSEIGPYDYKVGSREGLTNQDWDRFHSEQGHILTRLVSLGVSGSTTTMVVEVNNSGSGPVQLVGITVSGNFTGATTTCSITSFTWTATASSSSSDTENFHGRGNGYTSCRGFAGDHFPLTFIVSGGSSSTTTSTSSSTSGSCGDGQISQLTQVYWRSASQLTIAPGECILLTYTGTLAQSGGPSTLTPSTASGQSYVLGVLATNSPLAVVNCTLPLTPTSCSPFSGYRGF